ncbi:hypothetical protein [Persephonella sp.]
MPITITEEMLEKNPFFQKGKQEGRQEGLQEAVKSFYVNLGLSVEEIAKGLNISEEEVRKVLKENNLLKD